MKNPIDQFIKSAREVRLTDEAKGRTRSNLLAHMRVNPVRVISPYVSVFSSMFSRPVLALGVFLLVTLGGATTFAASGALPGEPLYPIKVNVIEPIKGFAVAVSPEEKAKWQVSLAEERVREVEQLATKERMTTEEGMRSRERFDDSIKEARETIKKLSKDNPDAAAELEASFTTSIISHENNLRALGSAASSTNAQEADEFAEYIRTSAFTTQDGDSGENNDSMKKYKGDKGDKKEKIEDDVRKTIDKLGF